jgi:hypothetical protein
MDLEYDVAMAQTKALQRLKIFPGKLGEPVDLAAPRSTYT